MDKLTFPDGAPHRSSSYLEKTWRLWSAHLTLHRLRAGGVLHGLFKTKTEKESLTVFEEIRRRARSSIGPEAVALRLRLCRGALAAAGAAVCRQAARAPNLRGRQCVAQHFDAGRAGPGARGRRCGVGVGRRLLALEVEWEDLADVAMSTVGGAADGKKAVQHANVIRKTVWTRTSTSRELLGIV